jgi:hypothetical protein
MAITLDGTNGITTETGTGDVSVGDDLIFTGTGNRITGDFSNATIANRVMFQTSTTNANTIVAAMPNGTGTTSGVSLANKTDPANTSWLDLRMFSTEASLRSTKTGTGTEYPMTFYTGGSERMRIDTSGNVSVGVNSTSARFQVDGSGATSAGNTVVVRNSAPTNLFVIRNDGYFQTGTAASSPYNATTGSGANCFINSDGGLYRSTSSLKYKQNVEDATHGLNELLLLRPVTYQGKSEADAGKTFGGLIAEEVHEAGLTEFVQYADDGSPDALAYGNMVSLCVKAIQELSAKNDALEARIAALEGAQA